MIKTFENFRSELDPFGEENWNEFSLDTYWDILKTMPLIIDLRWGSENEFIKFTLLNLIPDEHNFYFYLVDFHDGTIQIYCENTDNVDHLKKGSKEELLDKIKELSITKYWKSK